MTLMIIQWLKGLRMPYQMSIANHNGNLKTLLMIVANIHKFRKRSECLSTNPENELKRVKKRKDLGILLHYKQQFYLSNMSPHIINFV